MAKKNATPAAAKKNATKAQPAPAPETPAPAPAAAPAAKKDAAPLGKPRAAILAALLEKGPLTRAEISAATGIGSGFTSLLGHVDPAKREPRSLALLGLIEPKEGERDGKPALLWALTPAGRRAAKGGA